MQKRAANLLKDHAGESAVKGHDCKTFGGADCGEYERKVKNTAGGEAAPPRRIAPSWDHTSAHRSCNVQGGKGWDSF